MNARDAVLQVRTAVVRGELDLPLPRRGATAERWAILRAWGHRDLVVAKLVESHTDAVSVLADAGREPEADLVYAVWASASGRTGLKAERTADGGLRVEGRIRYASGVRFVDRALVIARSDEGTHLVELALPDPRVVPIEGSWTPFGMAATKSFDVDVASIELPPSAEIGAPGWYLERPGFWVNGIGVAAVWCGGAAGVLDDLVSSLAMFGEPKAHQLAHVGGAAAALAAADAAVWEAAADVDANPDGDHAAMARAVRHVVEQASLEVIDRAGRAAGPELLVHDAHHARRVADLAVFVRQVGAESDLELLGIDVMAAPGRWVR